MTTEAALKLLVDIAVERVDKVEVSEHIKNVKGFSTLTQRKIFNTLCSPQNTNYLEIGAYFGGTACAAIHKNPVNAYIVEDYSQPFGADEDVKTALIKNLAASETLGSYTLLEQDAFDPSKPLPSDIKFDVYFYDGNHSYENQKRAMQAFLGNMNEYYIQVVDDYSWEEVFKGTNDGLKELEDAGKIKVIHKFEKRLGYNDDPIWHNGLFIAVIKKLK